MKRDAISVLPSADAPISFKGHRFPPEIISYAVWLYYRFPLSLRMVEELLAARGIELAYETVRSWATKFGLAIAKRIRSTAPGRGDKWHLDDHARTAMALEQLAHQSFGCSLVAAALHQHIEHRAALSACRTT